VVVAHFGVALVIRLDDGRRQRVRVRRRSSHVVGDRVRLEGSELATLPATGVLRRRDAHGRVRSVASNLQVLGIVLAPRPPSPAGFVDRAVVAARAASIEPVVIVNKADLEGARALLEETRRTHAGLSHHLLLSAVRGDGLDALRELLAGERRAAFVGTSGVGKSSLLNALCPDLDLEVGEINESSGLGRHITSNATLHALPSGGELVDTPGFRDFGPVEVSPGELALYFPGFEELVSQRCHFRDCLHRAEPGCRVLEAVAEGRIEAGRHDAYLALLVDLVAAEGEARGY